MPILSEPQTQVTELEKCMVDIWYWLSKYVYTHDQVTAQTLAYPCWQYQKDYLNQISQPGRFLVEKSRDVMVSWTTILFCLHQLLFNPGWSGFIISRREVEVDDGGEFSTPDSLFGKLRFAYMHLPEWMTGQLRFSHLKISNTEEGMSTYLTGESSNDNSGRGKSATFKWADEFAVIKQSSKVHASMVGGNYRTLVYSSTSNLTGNEFYRLRHDPRSGFKIITIPWSSRPDRDDDWYERESRSMTPLQRAKELDIEYEFSSDLRIYSRFKAAVHSCDIKDMPLDKDEIYITFDEGLAKPGAMYACKYVNNRLYVLDEKYEAGIHVRLNDSEKADGSYDWVDVAKGFESKYGRCVCLTVGQESRAAQDIFTHAGFKTWRPGVDPIVRIGYVDRLMLLDEENIPRFLVSNLCENLLWEIPRYEWKTVAGLVIERPKPGNDHGCNAIEVLVEYLFSEYPNQVSSTSRNWKSNLNWKEAKKRW